MSAERTNDSETSVAGEAGGIQHMTIRILTSHDCQGVQDPETMQIDENVCCKDLDVLIDLGPLADITRVRFERLVRNAIILCCNDHDSEVLINCSLSSIDYIYDDPDEKDGVESLQGISDEGLRHLLAEDNGFIEVVWTS